MIRCEKCGEELTHLQVDMFDRFGMDDWIDVPISEHVNGLYIDVQTNWCGYEFDDDDAEKRDSIRCPECKRFPFESDEIQSVEYERVVMFKTESAQ